MPDDDEEESSEWLEPSPVFKEPPDKDAKVTLYARIRSALGGFLAEPPPVMLFFAYLKNTHMRAHASHNLY